MKRKYFIWFIVLAFVVRTGVRIYKDVSREKSCLVKEKEPLGEVSERADL